MDLSINLLTKSFILNLKDDFEMFQFYSGYMDAIKMTLSLVHLDRDVNLAGNAEAASNGLSAGAAAGAAVRVTVAVVVVGVAAAVVWMWRRHWILPCASTATKSEFWHLF